MQGTKFTSWDANAIRVYLIGNNLVYAINGISLILGILFVFVVAAIRKRGLFEPVDLAPQHTLMMRSVVWLELAWLLHYIPFIPMARVLYFHHYMSAALINCMLAGIMSDYMVCHVTNSTLLTLCVAECL